MPEADVIIVGQGIAGTLLGWELERAGVPFQIYDAGHEGAASRVAAGIINPVAGQRLAKSWRVGELLPVARAAYKAMGAALGIDCWREMRIRRLFRSESERGVLRDRMAGGALAGYLVEPPDE